MKDQSDHHCVSILESAILQVVVSKKLPGDIWFPRTPKIISPEIPIAIYFHIWTHYMSIIGRIGTYRGIKLKQQLI